MANLATISNNILADSGIDPINLIVGTGTVNYIPKFTGEDTLANSAIQDDGSSISIGRETFITGTTAYFQVGNGGAGTGKFQIEASSGSAIIGTRDASSIAFRTNLTTKMTLDTSGILGLGVTPSAWQDAKAIQVGSTAAPYLALFQQTTSTSDGYLGWNARLTGYRTFAYITTGDAVSLYRLNAGNHVWFNAPSGTAGNAISLTQAMTLGTNSGLSIGTPSAAPSQGLLVQGSVGIGTASITAKLVVAATTNAIARVTGTDNTAFSSSTFWTDQAPLLVINNTSTTVNTVAGIKFELGNTNAAAGIGAIQETSNSAAGLVFTTGGASSGNNNPERMRITSGGNVGIGTASPSARLTILTPTSDSTVGFNLRAFATGADGERTVISRYTSSNDNNWANSVYRAWAHIYETNGSEKMRLTSGGNLIINPVGSYNESLLTIKAANTNGKQIHIVQSNDDRGWRFSARTDGHFYLDSTYTGSDSNVLNARFDTGNVMIGSAGDNGGKLRVKNTTNAYVIAFEKWNSTLTLGGFFQNSGSSGEMILVDTNGSQNVLISSSGNSYWNAPSARFSIGTTVNTTDLFRVNGTTFSNDIMTWNPQNDNRSGIAWRFGEASIASITPNRRLRVNVGGTEYYIGAIEV